VRCAAVNNRLIPTWNVHEENEADMGWNAIRFLWNVLYQKNASDLDPTVRPPKTRRCSCDANLGNERAEAETKFRD